jgi:hypothetical protein
VPTRAPRPYQGHGDADPKGIAGRPGFGPGTSGTKGRCSAVELPPIVSRRPVPIRTARFTGAGPQPCAAAQSTPGGTRTRKHTLLKRARLPVAARAHGADTRGRTGPSPVRRGSREPRASAWLPGQESDLRGPASEAGWDASNPPGTGYGRRESNAQAAYFE